ncbi:glycine cleavage system aminomethyltransferase GcvT [Sphingopyxis sp. DHUNG17]|uniref:glycine cleavage system aminomethyltransferase GcvT n=1 Tax=Sphingopyxis jiangsuensis TaxID=2871171 RepID=UPI00191E5E9E|nr:glycine cleavage system aminomethyltransferase GcvT [Sphingopyxis lutea]MBL0768064.1 glycine cleavage system aminomethyltransferase GcvT [Sphingopyxis lutea]
MSETEDLIEEVATETLPLDAWHRAKGGRMVEFAGYWMPIQYEGIMAEHLWVRENAGLFDVSHMGQLLISGDGAAAALETLVPGDISALKPGRMRYSLLLAEDGGILDDLMITNEGDQFGIVVNGAVKWEDIGHLRENLPDHITLNHNEDYGLLALQGPKAVDALSRLVPEAAGLVFMQATRATWQGHAIGLSRSGYTGEDGFEISLPNAALEAFADALCAMDEVKPIGLGARDSLRLEAGLPLYGHDLDETIDPVEGDLGFAISKRRREEGGFPGAARILGHLGQGSARKRVGLLIDGKMPVREGAKLFDGNTEIGVVTSGGFAPSVGAPIAMGYVPTGLSEPGTPVAAEVRGKRVACTVTAMPFVPHRYVRKQGG